MTRMRWLWVAAGVMATMGLVLLVAPAATGEPDVAVAGIPEATPEKSPNVKAAELLSFEEIPRSNLFAQDRAAPKARYTPPGQQAERSVQRRTSSAAPRLFGVASGPNGAVALIDADPSIPGAEIYRLGDRVLDARLIQIADTMVVIEGAAGRIVLRLPSSRQGSP